MRARFGLVATRSSGAPGERLLRHIPGSAPIDFLGEDGEGLDITTETGTLERAAGEEMDAVVAYKLDPGLVHQLLELTQLENPAHLPLTHSLNTTSGTAHCEVHDSWFGHRHAEEAGRRVTVLVLRRGLREAEELATGWCGSCSVGLFPNRACRFPNQRSRGFSSDHALAQRRRTFPGRRRGVQSKPTGCRDVRAGTTSVVDGVESRWWS